MRLIENYRRVIRQHRTVRAIAQRQVGKKQMMIDDDDVGVDGPLTHARDKARLEIRALLTQTSIGARIDVPPERKVFRKSVEFCSIARLCFGDPAKDFIKVIDFVEAFEHGHALGALDTMQ